MHDKNIKDDRGYNQGWADSKSTRIRAERRCDYMISQMHDNANSNILEIGCGTGDISYMLAKKTQMQVLGTDLCRPFIDDAKKIFQLPNLSFDVLDFNKADEFKGNKFSYIVGNGILHHLYYNLDQALVNLRLLLKDNGKIIFLEPNLLNPYIYLIFSYANLREKAHLEPDEMAFSKSLINKKLKSAGFTNIKIEYRDFLLPGIPESLIKPSIVVGNIVEKVPVLRNISQSIYIVASA